MASLRAVSRRLHQLALTRGIVLTLYPEFDPRRVSALFRQAVVAVHSKDTVKPTIAQKLQLLPALTSSSSASAAILQTMWRARSLSARCCDNLTDYTARYLTQCSALTSISFRACKNLTDQAARYLTQCSALASVRFRWCQNLTDQAARALSNCPALTSVDFSKCGNLTDEAVRALAACLTIKSANFTGIGLVTDELRRAYPFLALYDQYAVI